MYLEAGPRDRPDGSHAGLWYDKFCDKWQRDGQSWSMKSADAGRNPKLCWINTVTGSAVGANRHLDEHANRLARLVRGRGGEFRVFSTSSRFVTGLGRSHPVENGFAWHPTLGTPYLPGSSVKGMVRAWAIAEGEGTGEPLARLLGDRKSGAAGTLAFMDAVPVERVQLEADVMTPHYANWTTDAPPGDWRSPTPIPFLAVAAGTKMLFGVIPCRDATAEDTGIVMEWIADALAWQGAGAKTAVGYGRFERDDPGRKSLDEQLQVQEEEKSEAARLVLMDRFDREIARILEDPRWKGMPHTTAIFKGMETGIAQNHWEGDDIVELAKRLEQRMRNAKQWKQESFKKNPRKDKDHQRTLQVMAWLSQG